MIKHKRIYCQEMDISQNEASPCEACVVFNKKPIKQITDVHHCSCRGMGGDPSGKKDTIENLGGVCRECHDELESDVRMNSTFTQYCKQVQFRKSVIKNIMNKWGAGK